MFFSIIIPLYNRPQEIDELLSSLTKQSYYDFEVLVIEDGSNLKAEEIVNSYQDRIQVRYYYKENAGQGFARNYGFERAKGDYFIIFDSDILLPSNYLYIVNQFLETNYVDAFGGPDAAHESFTAVQKAISYSMTSPLTTGGIRGNKRHIGAFHPRSFNMGVSRKVWETVGGFLLTRLGEDIEYSIRIQEAGFKTALVPDAFVYHKRRTDFKQFYKQLHFFGRARINIYRHFPSELKLVHFFPAAFVFFIGLLLVINIFSLTIASFGNALLFIYTALLFIHALIKTKDLQVTVLSVIASYIQLIAYGMGFITDFWKRLVLR